MRNRHGFTLIEIMVGVLISAMTVAIVRYEFAALAEGSEHLTHHRLKAMRRHNATRWLGEALASMEAGDGRDAFAGERHQLHCTTWTLGPGGWPQRTPLELKLVNTDFRATTQQGSITLFSNVGTVALEYLVDPSAGTPWVSQWESTVSVPYAIRVRLAYLPHVVKTAPAIPPWSDTLTIIIGSRG